MPPRFSLPFSANDSTKFLALRWGFAPHNPYAYMLICAAAGGFGVYIIDILINSAIPETYGPKSVTLLPLGHGIYCVGAMAAPIVATTLIDPASSESFSRPYLVIAVLSAVMAAAMFVISRMATPFTPYAKLNKSNSKSDPFEIFRSKKAWIIIALSFCYFSFEAGYCNWLPTYARDVLGMSFKTAGTLMTIVFFSSLIMKFFASYIFRKTSIRWAFIISCSLSSVLAAACFIIRDAKLAFVLMPLSVLFSGVASPGLILTSCRVFPKRTASASSAVLMSISISSIILPYIMGLIAENIGFQFSIFTIVIMEAAAVVIMALFRDQTPVINHAGETADAE